MSEWITYRRPSCEDDLVTGLVFVSLPEVNRVIIKSAVEVVLGEPWQRIPTPEPYVKPKRWTVKWGGEDGNSDFFTLYDSGEFRYYLPELTSDQSDAAQRICDIYNEVLP